MDSCNLQSATTSSSVQSYRKLKAEDDSLNVVSSKKIYFTGPCRRQAWSLPDSIMYYMAMNPKSAEVYQKLVKSCKYFYIKNPIIVVTQLDYFQSPNKWQMYNGKESLYLANITTKIWITDLLSIDCTISNQNLVSSIIPKIRQCSAKRLYLWDQVMSFEDFCVLSQLANEINLTYVTVKNVDGSIVAFEKIVEASPKLKEIRYKHENSISISSITSKTVSELVKIPHFLKLEDVQLIEIPETFDVNAFCLYRKINKCTTFYLRFNAFISDAYKNRLDAIIDELIETKTHNYKPVIINYSGLDREKFWKLFEL